MENTPNNQPDIQPADQAQEQEQPYYCPECGMPAFVEDAGPAAGLVKVRCFGRHWFLMLRDRLDGMAA